MKRKRRSPEQIIRKLRDADRLGSRWKAVCEFEFSLWDADATGEQVGRTLTFDGWQPKQPRLVVGDGMIETAVASPIIRPQVYEKSWAAAQGGAALVAEGLVEFPQASRDFHSSTRRIHYSTPYQRRFKCPRPALPSCSEAIRTGRSWRPASSSSAISARRRTWKS